MDFRTAGVKSFVEALPGAPMHTAPDSHIGAYKSFQRQGIKVWCSLCNSTRAIAKVMSIEQLERAANYAVILECAHSRTITLAVQRSASNKRALAETEAKRLAFEEKQDAKESAEIRDAMECDGLL